MNRHAHVVRNVLVLLLSQIGTWSVTFVLTLVVPPYLGIKLYGLYSFVNSFAGFFALGMTLGTGTYLTWRIAREPEEAGRLTFNTLAMQVPLALVSTMAALLILPHVDSTQLVAELVSIGLASTVLSALTGTCVAVLAGQQNMRIPSLISVCVQIVGAVLIIIAIHLRANIVVLAAAGLSTQAISLTILLVYTQIKIRMRPRIDVRLWRTILIGGLPFCGWSAVLLIYGQIDMTLLKILVGDTVVGWYAVAVRVISIPMFLPTIVITAILPALASERDALSRQFSELASRSIRLVTAVGIPAAAGTAILATHIMDIFHFPASFQPAGPLIAIMAPGIPIVAVDMVLGTVLIAIGRQKAWTGVGIVAAIVNPLANFWAIQFTQHTFGDGAIGASVVTVLTEMLMCVGALLLRPRSVMTGSDVFYMFRCLFATAIMVPGVWALSSVGLNIVAAVGYGLVLYAMAAYTLQIVTINDLNAIVSVVITKLGMNGSNSIDHQVGAAIEFVSSREATPELAPVRITLSRTTARLSHAMRTATAQTRSSAERMAQTISRSAHALSLARMQLTPMTMSADAPAAARPVTTGIARADHHHPAPQNASQRLTARDAAREQAARTTSTRASFSRPLSNTSSRDARAKATGSKPRQAPATSPRKGTSASAKRASTVINIASKRTMPARVG